MRMFQPTLLVALVVLIGLTSCARPQPKPPKTPEFTYIAVGNSSTFGIGAFPLTRGYAFLINDALEDRTGNDVNFLNLGIPGGEVDNMLEVLRLALRHRAKPDLVTVWAGPNDLIDGEDPEVFAEDLGRLLDLVKRTSSATLIVGNLPRLHELPRFQEDPDPDVTPERIQSFNRVIEQEVNERDAQEVDLFAMPVEEMFVSDVDGFHPSNEGHQRVAELFLAQIFPELDRARIASMEPFLVATVAP